MNNLSRRHSITCVYRASSTREVTTCFSSLMKSVHFFRMSLEKKQCIDCFDVGRISPWWKFLRKGSQLTNHWHSSMRISVQTLEVEERVWGRDLLLLKENLGWWTGMLVNRYRNMLNMLTTKPAKPSSSQAPCGRRELTAANSDVAFTCASCYGMHVSAYTL